MPPAKRTFLINDLFWIAVAGLFCLGGYRLGFGTFQKPHAGFMPLVAGCVLGGLALLDLAVGLVSQWRDDKDDQALWRGVNWPKLLATLGVMLLYVLAFTTLGFFLDTFLLLLFLYRVLEPKPWWVTGLVSAATTAIFYLVFKVGLDSQLPQGFLGF
jgi:uncharacterized membrane-anchored protein